jgi:hypothetical protein
MNSFHIAMVRLFFLVFVICMTGCAMGNKYDLAHSAPDISRTGKSEIAIGVHDIREYIANGDKSPDFIGLQRGGFGNPFDVKTESGDPLSEDISRSLIAGLEKRGYKAETVKLLPSVTLPGAKTALVETGKERSLLVTVINWKSDTMYNVALHYDLTAVVFDGSGNKIAENNVHGINELGGYYWNPPEYAGKAVPRALAEKLDALIDTPEILNALTAY